jgi:plasmid stability protein
MLEAVMAQILVRGLEDELVATLKDRARANDRSLEGEVRAILKSVVDRDQRHKRAVAEIEKLQAEFAGRTTGDSVELLHEGRAEWGEKWGSS